MTRAREVQVSKVDLKLSRRFLEQDVTTLMGSRSPTPEGIIARPLILVGAESVKNKCRSIIGQASDELFAISLILDLIEQRGGPDMTLAAKGKAAVERCQKLITSNFGDEVGAQLH
jgi:hypothetical protein